MGQSINVLLYGARIPDGLDVFELIEEWEVDVDQKVNAYEARLRRRTHRSWPLAQQAFVPRAPNPDDCEPDNLVGFYVCNGHYDDAGSHRFPAMTFAQMRREEPTASIIRRCRRRWSRFARWARARGVEFGKPRIWRTRTEVA